MTVGGFKIHFLIGIRNLNSRFYCRMSVGNLSIVFGPNLVDAGNGTESENVLGSKLVETLIVNADFFFPNCNFLKNESFQDDFSVNWLIRFF